MPTEKQVVTVKESLGIPLLSATLAFLLSSTQLPGQSTRSTKEQRAARDLAALWTPDIEVAVNKGLAWLAEKQDPRGFWYTDAGAKGSDWDYHNYRIEVSASEQRRRGTGHIGVTAFAGMAFLAAGHLPNRGKYGKLVQKTLDYILDHVSENGLITDSGTRMYSHALSTLFLAEVYGMTREKRIKQGLENAVHIIVDGQNAAGGWRYYLFSKDSDLSITVCQLQALRAARNIGIRVPESTIKRAVKYVVDSRVEGGDAEGLYYYKQSSRNRGRGWGRRSRRRKQKEYHFAINACAVTALVSAGVYDPHLIRRPVDYLLERLPEEIEDFRHHYQFWYGNYYASQALFHAERLVREKAFTTYFRQIRDHLLNDQEEDGNWKNDVGPGDPFSTAVACIVLQVPKQYLPIFQR